MSVLPPGSSETAKLFERRLSVLPPNANDTVKNNETHANINNGNQSNAKKAEFAIPAIPNKFKDSEFARPSPPMQRGKRMSFAENLASISRVSLMNPCSPLNGFNNTSFKTSYNINKTTNANVRDIQNYDCVEKRPKVNQDGISFISFQDNSSKVLYCNKNDGTAKIYGFARNIAFALLNDDNNKSRSIFKCHIPSCSNHIMDEMMMKSHIETSHDGQIWNGYCANCSKLYFFPEKENCDVTMLDEFDHIRSTHFGCAIEKTSTGFKIPTTSNSGKNLAAFNNSGMDSQGLRNRSLTLSSRPSMDPRLNKSLHVNSTTIPSEKFYTSFGTINLRPWFYESENHKKIKAASLAMLHEDPLTAFFKCMERTCAYFTCSSDNYRRHLTLHKSINNMCSYCPYQNYSVENLLKHLNDEHGCDCFACGFCFYRSCSEGNMMTHIKRFHDDKKSAVIIEIMRRGSREHRDKLYMEARSYVNISKFVSKFECLCGVQFYLFNDFEKHVKNHGNGDMNQLCKNCHHKITLKDLIEHNEKCLKKSCIQCIHCHFGCQNIHKIFEHLANYHASKVAMYCERIESVNNVSNEIYILLDI